jgi:acetate kinase
MVGRFIRHKMKYMRLVLRLVLTGKSAKRLRTHSHERPQGIPSHSGFGEAKGARVMKKAGSRVLVINGGSSSIKFALFEAGDALKRLLKGSIKGVGRARGEFAVQGVEAESFSRDVAVPDHTAAVSLLMDWVQEKMGDEALLAVGHRVVHGGPKYWEPERITPEMLVELHQLSTFDPEHLPEELLLMEAFQKRFPDLAQFACFDTAFHHAMPRVAKLLPIPRRFEAQGVQRYGFHGLSYAYLMQELERIAGSYAAHERLILAHLGSGASMAAVHAGRSIDTTMGFTPASGLMMSTRAGDIDPGLFSFLARSGQGNTEEWDRMLNHESGLLGVSETSADMQDLLAKEADDVRAAEAVELFCYQAKKNIGAYAAALGGLDTLVFAGGIGENAAPVRTRICAGLGFLGIELDEERNAAAAAVISSDASRVMIRVIQTDEEIMIAQSVWRVIGSATKN